MTELHGGTRRHGLRDGGLTLSRLSRTGFWLKELLAGLTAVSGVGYLATAYTVSRWLTRPSRGTPHHPPAAQGLSWEPLECRTADRLRLRGWVVTPPEPRATVALFHGMRNNREQT